MHVTVRLLNGSPKRLTYRVPSHLEQGIEIGTIVEVPLQKRLEAACIEEIVDPSSLSATYTLRDIHAYDRKFNNKLYKKFVEQVSSYYAVSPLGLYRRFYSFIGEERSREQEPHIASLLTDKTFSLTLTPEQHRIVDAIAPSIVSPLYQPFVIQGVTGSGKTEIYHHLILTAQRAHKLTLLLLPEVSLAIRFTQLLKERYKTDLPVFGFHSGASALEKRTLWAHLDSNKPALIIGVHLPVFLPILQLGLIIIDEEHETGYQEKKHPKINTKEAALIRAQLYNIPIVLGSATPSIATLYNTQAKHWKLFRLEKRFAGAFPRISVVKLNRQEKRSHFWISKELESAIAHRLTQKEQIIIFLNRRGYSFFVQCSLCGGIPKCSSCSVSLTFHEDDSLRCHYCNYYVKLNDRCPSCSQSKLIKKGIGTQQVVSILKGLFPMARIDRADLDTTVNRKKWQAIVQAFSQGDLDILVGTQTITKGYHFPGVTLVGILWADMYLSFPTYNASEVTLQQLIQVAGRAGRQSNESMVIVQTMLDHPLWSFLSEERYQEFYSYEVERRSLMGYPPLARFAEIELRCDDEATVERESLNCFQALESLALSNKWNVKILGPSEPLVSKIKNVHIRKIYLKSDTLKAILTLYSLLQKQHNLRSALFFTPNPLSL
jgi:primosomal protein N' (replication factor Y) (superfamily II helicase)